MAVFEDSEGKKIKTTHFGQRGASDYTKHGDKERMQRYLERHGGGTTTSTKEDWKDPTTAGALSRWILWNKPSLSASFSDYKSRFGLKGTLNVSKSAEERKCKSCEKPATTVVQEGSFCYECLPINLGAENQPLCANKPCVRIANGTDGIGFCMPCEDDASNNRLIKEATEWVGLSAETFEANAKTGNKVYIITRRCEDYSAYRELDVAGFGSLTEARKKFNILFKEAKKQDYADYTIADAKYYMSWGEFWGIMSFNDGEMIYELREVIVGDKGDFYFDAEGEINE